MSIWDYLILAAVAAAVFFAVRWIVRRRKKGGCVGCSGNCSACNLYSLEKQAPAQNADTKEKPQK